MKCRMAFQHLGDLALLLHAPMPAVTRARIDDMNGRLSASIFIPSVERCDRVLMVLQRPAVAHQLDFVSVTLGTPRHYVPIDVATLAARRASGSSCHVLPIILTGSEPGALQ